MSTSRVTSKGAQLGPRLTMFYEGRLIGIAHTPGLFVPQPVPHEGPAMVKEQFPLSKRACNRHDLRPRLTERPVYEMRTLSRP